MKTEDQLVVLAHVQYVAKFYCVLKCSIEKLIELIRFSIGNAAPPADAIEQFLRREEVQTKLETAYETAIWVSSDRNKTWRLVSLSFPPEADVCRRRLSEKIPLDACAFCLIQERGYDLETMIPEKDLAGRVTGVITHRACARPLRQMRDLVERNS